MSFLSRMIIAEILFAAEYVSTRLVPLTSGPSARLWTEGLMVPINRPLGNMNLVIFIISGPMRLRVMVCTIVMRSNSLSRFL